MMMQAMGTGVAGSLSARVLVLSRCLKEAHAGASGFRSSWHCRELVKVDDCKHRRGVIRDSDIECRTPVSV
jgi:hypothetical protein